MVLFLRRLRDRRQILACLRNYVITQSAIALELRFREELVQRRRVREILKPVSILEYIARFVARDGRLQIEHIPKLVRVLRIANRSDGEVIRANLSLFGTQTFQIAGNFNTEII